MRPVRDSMWAFVSLSGPHLGFTEDTPTLLKSGLGCLLRIGSCCTKGGISANPSSSLHELRGSRGGAGEEHGGALAWATGGQAHQGKGLGLAYFSHVIFVVGRQDLFVPYLSASLMLDNVGNEWRTLPTSRMAKTQRELAREVRRRG